MIQRIQTLYLAVGAVLLAAAPFAGALDEGPAADLSWFLPATGLALGVAFLVSVAAIFLYSNRRRQRVLVVVAQLVTLLALIGIFIGRRSTESLPGAASSSAADWMLFLFPAVTYVLFLLARRAIDRDIRLVESVDRLR